ncbi:helix-turn-helix domain-containing protein [Adhaeribacter radiodurans]|uniref:Helix-turn-helix domain-containing protein n=1 Tax=Adhaeribacter radiodurans TaxID=2745197 RepID=A0A7L7L6I7_9BACT|nr:helix-turn-helix domain-containing protein [Adhaeribacter radiodurans]QMU28125.1 helix-turn-helix domain-containing protein [Adhaeribacter radiodurans]
MKHGPVVTFEQLPKAVTQLFIELEDLKQLVLQKNNTLQPVADHWFTIDELCAYLPGNPAKTTIYSKVHNREIPHKKIGKRLAFRKSEIDQWLSSQTRKTILEIEAEAEAFIQTSKNNKA